MKPALRSAAALALVAGAGVGIGAWLASPRGASEPAGASGDATERDAPSTIAAGTSVGSSPRTGMIAPLDAGVRSAEAGVPATAPFAAAPSPTVPTPRLPSLGPSDAPPRERDGPRPEVTLAQEYEATSFFLDMLVLRRDTVTRDLAEARRVGDGPRLRRLEPDLAVLEGDIGRYTARQHELESRLAAERAAGDDDAPATPAEAP